VWTPDGGDVAGTGTVRPDLHDAVTIAALERELAGAERRRS
jgi:hypothetical protein